MTIRSFYEEGSKLLTPGAFQFVLDSELKRAVRSQNFLTLVTVEASREWDGMTVTADDGTRMGKLPGWDREGRDDDWLSEQDDFDWLDDPRVSVHAGAPHLDTLAARRQVVGHVRLRTLDARHRPSRRAHRELRVSHGAAHRGRGRMLSDARRRRRLAQAPGDVASDRELARRHPTVRSELTMDESRAPQESVSVKRER